MTGSRTPTGLRTSIRVRAALAGGLVFGLAAGLTVASWTDAEFAKPTFTASNFVVQTSVSGAAYVSTTPLDVPVSGVYPGSTGRLYVPVLLRTAPGSIAGSVTVGHAAIASPAGLTAVLQYRVVRSTTCDSSVFTAGASYVAGGVATTPLAATAIASTSVGALAANGASPIGLCMEFSLPTGLTQATYQGTSTVPLAFTFSGTSS
ncbi:MAG TPA: SipW-dependent-type signal peptide-containing protein [Pseudolysinimonas sp.]|jgi:predicted ribosomally synthesized peptide with SipW-like signal peptide|nr:SipW-dependent-type signal peptide-containing protein [Pseudolysinimonas sp.]